MARGGNGRVGNALGQRSRVASGNDAHDDEAIGIATSWGSLVFSVVWLYLRHGNDYITYLMQT